MQFPILETTRLVLRPFTLEDAPTVQQLAGDYQVARTNLAIPHPYPPGAATTWIATHWKSFADCAFIWAIERGEDSELLGSVDLRLEAAHRRAELGYWLGAAYWGQGYATEAAAAVVRYGFKQQNLNRIYAFHFTNNPASGRVLQKVGMIKEGCRRQHTFHEGEFLDSLSYGILRSDYIIVPK